MKCLEGYTVEQIKEMSFDELKVVWQKVVEEHQGEEVRRKMIELIELDNVNTVVVN